MANKHVTKLIKQLFDLTNFTFPLENINVTNHDPILPSNYYIGEAGAAVLSIIGAAIATMWQQTTGHKQKVAIDVFAAALAMRSHNYLKIMDSKPFELWSPFSGFYQTKDQRFIQLHCNFPHHQTGVLNLLQCKDNKDSVIDAIKQWDAQPLETALSNAGMCVAMIRTAQEWEQHPQAKAIATLPLLEITKIADSAPQALPVGQRPLSNLNVLDLTRVIAGPIAGRTFAEHGANVLRISAPHLPFIEGLVIDTGFGKNNAALDLRDNKDCHQLFTLLNSTDVFLQSYRPHALHQFACSPQELAQQKPGIICVDLSAYGRLGPWKERRGFDSLVQSACGIVAENSDENTPQHLPAQALDYITGYLACYGTLIALLRRAQEGGSYHVQVSLAQTAHWLKQLGRSGTLTEAKKIVLPSQQAIAPWLIIEETGFGKVQHLKPVLDLSLTPPFWDKPAMPLGSHNASWI